MSAVRRRSHVLLLYVEGGVDEPAAGATLGGALRSDQCDSIEASRRLTFATINETLCQSSSVPLLFPIIFGESKVPTTLVATGTNQLGY